MAVNSRIEAAQKAIEDEPFVWHGWKNGGAVLLAALQLYAAVDTLMNEEAFWMDDGTETVEHRAVEEALDAFLAALPPAPEEGDSA